jgi:hypothetical protein
MAVEEQHGSLSAKDRLAQISHHFLSEEEDIRATLGHGMTSWGLVSPSTMNLFGPWQAIGRALAAQGLPPLVIDTSAIPVTAAWILDIADPGSNLNGLAETYRQRVRAMDVEPRVCLVIAGLSRHTALRACDGILVPACADPTGLRAAYGALKELSALVPKATFGVVVTDVADEDAARRAFGVLSVASQRFLGRQIGSFGYLSRDALQTPFEGRRGLASDLLSEEAHGIASLIATDSLMLAPRRADDG